MSESDKSRHEPITSPETPLVIALNAASAGSLSEREARRTFELALNNGTRAFVLMGTPNGTIPDYLNPFITHSVEQGVPVFILSTNYASNSGPNVNTLAPYESQVEVTRAGGIILRDVNVKGLPLIIDTINGGIAEGYDGSAISQVLIERFGIPEGLVQYASAK